jgi:hypothetical protein
MSETTIKHTPGPWEAKKVAVLQWSVWRVERRIWERPIVNLHHGVADEREGNARLIAAAPDMFAVLQRIAAHFENTDAPLGLDAAALVARIEGREVEAAEALTSTTD